MTANNIDGLADFKASDLQTAKISVSSTTGTATMNHKMGVAEIELKTATYYAIAEANNGTASITRTSDTNEEVTASSSFSTASPYHLPVRKGTTALYYAVVPIGTGSTQFNSTTGSDQWSSDVTATNISSGAVGHYDAYSTRVGTSTYSGSFSFSGTCLTFTVPFTGTYTIECWGAGYNAVSGCMGGAYVSGQIILEENMQLFVYVGATSSLSTSYAFNGGGPSQKQGGYSGSTGCGGTDVRTTQHSSANGWGGTASLRSRIIVAGGAGVTNTNSYRDNSSSAGGLNGYAGIHSETSGSYDTYCGKGGSQTAGGSAPALYSDGTIGTKGDFGYGGTGGKNGQTYGGCGGGGGWYGGSGASGATSSRFAGGGGSSFISGHPYCNGINSSGTHQGAGKSSKVLFEGTGSEHTITFTNTKMIDGSGRRWISNAVGSSERMPNPAGNYYSVGIGHSGNGFCRICGTTAADN